MEEKLVLLHISYIIFIYVYIYIHIHYRVALEYKYMLLDLISQLWEDYVSLFYPLEQIL